MSFSTYPNFVHQTDISEGVAWTGDDAVGIKQETNVEEFEVTPEINNVYISEQDTVNSVVDLSDEEFEDFREGATDDKPLEDGCCAASANGAGNYCCDECGLVAGRRRALVRHLRDDHLRDVGGGRRSKAEKKQGGGGRTTERKQRRRRVERQPWEAEEERRPRKRRRRRRAESPPPPPDPTEWISFYTAERGGGRGFSCNACHFDCLRLADFKRHVATQHSTKRIEDADKYPLLAPIFDVEASAGEILRCQVCCYEANSRSHLTMHMKVHGTAGFSDGQTAVVFPCEMCGFKASTKSHLTKHKKVHERTSFEDADDTAKRKSLCCDICGYRTVSRQSLAVHRHNHAGRRPFACTTCGYRAANRERLAVHSLGHTARGRPFACRLCPFRTAYRRGLAEHERKHTGERPYACVQCEYRAANRSNLTRHVANIHVAGGGTTKTMGYNAPHRPYPCPRCPYRSTNRSNLTRHLTNMHKS